MAATQIDSDSRKDLFSDTLIDLDALKSDTVALTVKPRAFMANVAGNVKITDVQGTAITLTVLAGIVYPIRPTILWSTGTTATGLIGLL